MTAGIVRDGNSHILFDEGTLPRCQRRSMGFCPINLKRCLKGGLIFILVAACFDASADVAFASYSGTDGDIAAASSWGGVLPNAEMKGRFTNEVTATYSASTDATFHSIFFEGKDYSATMDFSSTPARVISLANDKDAAADDSAFFLKTKRANVQLKGGTWYSSSSPSKGYLIVGSTSTYSGNTLVFDGSCVTNFGVVHVDSNGTVGNSLILTNSASLYCGSLFLTRTKAGHDNLLELNNGSKLYANEFITDWFGTKSATSGFSSFLARGPDTLVKVAKFSIGNRHDGFFIRFTDGARAVVSERVQFGNYSSNGCSDTSTGNTLLIDDGASVDAARFVVGQSTSGNSLIVSNATISYTTAFTIGADTIASNNLFRIAGETATMNANYVYPFGNGFKNTYEITDHAQVTNISSMWISNTGSNNVFRVLNGATLLKPADKPKNLWVGGDTATGRDNLMVIGDGSLVTAYRFHTTGIGNALVVSNGTLKTFSATAYPTSIGSQDSDHNGGVTYVTNNLLRLEGSHPALRVDSANCGVRVINNSSIVFAIPAGGYDLGHVPVSGGRFQMTAGSKIRFELDDFLKSLGRKKVKYITLVETSTAFDVPETVIADANENLPEGCKVFVEDGKLILKAIVGGGFTLYLH